MNKEEPKQAEYFINLRDRWQAEKKEQGLKNLRELIEKAKPLLS